MKKIGLISDIHGNTTAAREVIQDAKQNGVDEFWFLGDLFMPGPGRSELLHLLLESNTTTFVKGNWDGCLTSVIEEYETINYDDPEEVFIFKLVHYVMKDLTEEELKFMFNIPMTVEREIYGVKFHLSHNLPENFGGGDLIVQSPAENFAKLFEYTDAQIAIYGHIHQPVMRRVGMGDERAVINPGAVSTTQNKDSSYSILKVEACGKWSIEFRNLIHNHKQDLIEARRNDLSYYELYEDTVLNHIHHTHDVEGIDKVNKKYNYVHDLKAWLSDETMLTLMNKFRNKQLE